MLTQVRDLTPFADSLGFAVEEYAAGKGKIPPRSVAGCNGGKHKVEFLIFN